MVITALRRLRSWKAARRVEAELAEEMETHRQMTEGRLQDDWMAASEARAKSHQIMGNLTLAREDPRRIWTSPWVSNIGRDVRYALRMLTRTPGFTAIGLLTLALGIGATTALFSVADEVLFKPLPVKAPARLVVLGWTSGPGGQHRGKHRWRQNRSWF